MTTNSLSQIFSCKQKFRQTTLACSGGPGRFFFYKKGLTIVYHVPLVSCHLNLKAKMTYLLNIVQKAVAHFTQVLKIQTALHLLIINKS